MRIDLQRLGRVSHRIGSAKFSQELFNLFHDAIDVACCSVFAFEASSEPRIVMSEGVSPNDCSVVRRLAADYVSGAYRDDPNVSSRNIARAPTVYGMRTADLAANPDYRRYFYEETRIAYELVQLIPCSGVLFYVSLYRYRGSAPFYSKDVIAMRQLGRFAVPALQRHLDLRRDAPAPSWNPGQLAPPADCWTAGALREHMREVFLDTPHRLSKREAEVCTGIVLGYTTLDISAQLDIAVDTVATHRKRAYKKLGVCSQAELFARYFEAVRRIQTSAPTRA